MDVSKAIYFSLGEGENLEALERKSQAVLGYSCFG